MVTSISRNPVGSNLGYYNIFCSLNAFFSSSPASSSRGHGPVSRRRCSCVPHAPPPTSCRASTPHLRHDDGALLTDNVRDEQTTRPQGRRANTGDLMESQGGCRDHETSKPEVVSPQKTSMGCGSWPCPGPCRHQGCGLVSQGPAGEWWGLPRADRTPGRA